MFSKAIYTSNRGIQLGGTPIRCLHHFVTRAQVEGGVDIRPRSLAKILRLQPHACFHIGSLPTSSAAASGTAVARLCAIEIPQHPPPK